MLDFEYTAIESGWVAVILSSTADALYFQVSSPGIDLSLAVQEKSSRILGVFNTIAGQPYSISIGSSIGEEPFELKLVQPNRESLGLSDNEYFASWSEDLIATCNGVQDITNSEYYAVFNFAEGYITDTSKSFQLDFTSVSGNTVKVITDVNDGQGDNSFSLRSARTYTVNEADASISGTSSAKSVYTRDGETKICIYSSTVTGNILF